MFSNQEPYEFDNNTLQEEIKSSILDLTDSYGDDLESNVFIEKLRFLKELQDTDFSDEPEYIAYCRDMSPYCWEWEDTPTGKRYDHSIEVIFDAFDEITRRIKENGGDE